MSRLSRLVLLAILGLLLLVAALVWRGGRTRATRLLYLGWDAQDRVQLYSALPDGSSATTLTRAPLEVLDYALSPDGQTVVYSSAREDGGSDLWLVDQDGSDNRRLLECPGEQCRGAVWRPDGGRIVYERRSLPTQDAAPGRPRLWWLDPGSGETTPLFSDSRLLGSHVRFSSGGRWISFVVPPEDAVQIHNLQTGESIRIPDGSGEPAAWHPEQELLLVSTIQPQGERFSVYIIRVALPSGRLTNMSDQTTTNDGAPAWSPGAEWIAFGRKVPRSPLGRQLWRMRADGGDTLQLTNDPQSHFGPPAWSPDGTELLFQRFEVNDPAARPEIWRLHVADRRLQKVTGPGFRPTWLP